MLDTSVHRRLDQAPYTGRILRYLISRYPEQSVALLSQITVTTLIVLATIVRVMILTIHFKYQLLLMAVALPVLKLPPIFSLNMPVQESREQVTGIFFLSLVN